MVPDMKSRIYCVPYVTIIHLKCNENNFFVTKHFSRIRDRDLLKPEKSLIFVETRGDENVKIFNRD